ncbi:MAG: response regulator transcription factor [Brockia lithotrophica]|nr:response regulator transcription factor [Brockia lithotrophica]
METRRISSEREVSKGIPKDPGSERKGRGRTVRKILVVDDEPSIVTLLKFNLEREGYRVLTGGEGREAIKIVERERPDLLLLDVMLPGLDGFEVLRRIRARDARLPVLLLTAKGEELDRVLGLELGADDYITKPFSVREVLARIKAVFRRAEREEMRDAGRERYDFGDLVVDLERYEVTRFGKPVDLTPKEYELLAYLVRNRGRALTREQLVTEIWNFEYVGDSRIVDVHVSHLREKIEDNPRNPKYIHTVRGIGYKFEAPSAAEERAGADGE